MPAATPTVVNSWGGSIQGAQVPTSVSANAGDLLIVTGYFEPSNEGSSSATYGTITAPTGFTMMGSPVPANSNDANLTSQNTQRSYIAYEWVATTGSVAISDFGRSCYYGFGSLIQIRGAVGQSGSASGLPYKEITSASSQNVSSSTFPAVSLTTAGSNNLLLFVGTDWDSGHGGTLAGWTSRGTLNSSVALTKAQSSAGTTGSVAPTPDTSRPLLTSILMSFRGN